MQDLTWSERVQVILMLLSVFDTPRRVCSVIDEVRRARPAVLAIGGEPQSDIADVATILAPKRPDWLPSLSELYTPLRLPPDLLDRFKTAFRWPFGRKSEFPPARTSCGETIP